MFRPSPQRALHSRSAQTARRSARYHSVACGVDRTRAQGVALLVVDLTSLSLGSQSKNRAQSRLFLWVIVHGAWHGAWHTVGARLPGSEPTSSVVPGAAQDSGSASAAFILIARGHTESSVMAGPLRRCRPHLSPFPPQRGGWEPAPVCRAHAAPRAPRCVFVRAALGLSRGCWVAQHT